MTIPSKNMFDLYKQKIILNDYFIFSSVVSIYKNPKKSLNLLEGHVSISYEIFVSRGYFRSIWMAIYQIEHM